MLPVAFPLPTAMKSRPLLLLLLLPLLGMKKCESEPEPVFTLPAVTQSGANTCGFEVDGRVWITYGVTCYYGAGGCAANKLLAGYDTRNRAFYLNTWLTTPKRRESFSLRFDSLKRIGTYQLNADLVPQTSIRAVRSLIFTDESEAVKGYYNLPQKGGKASITITKLDTVQRIVAGTFGGTFQQSLDTTKQVRITAGRFDVKY